MVLPCNLSISVINGEPTATGSRQVNFARGLVDKHETKDSKQAITSWDWDGSMLTCRTSTTGYIPLYYCAKGNNISISTSLTSIAEEQASVCHLPSLILFLVLGEYIEESTPFNDIKALPLDATLNWSLKKGLDVNISRKALDCNKFNYKEALHYYDDLLYEEVQKHPDQDCAMGLTSGNDSRHILLVLDKLGYKKPHLFTSYHYLKNLSETDVEVAGRLAKALESEVSTVYPIENRYTAELIKNNNTEFQVLDHSWAINLIKAVQPYQIFYDGMNGGVLFGRSSLVKLVKNNFGNNFFDWSLIKDFIISSVFEKRIAFLKKYINDVIFSEENVYLARNILSESLEKYRDFQNPPQAYLYYNHVARNTSFFTYTMKPNMKIFCPLDSPEMVSFALALPWEISSDPDFQKKSIRKKYPVYAGIPFSEEYKPNNNGIHVNEDSESSSRAELLPKVCRYLTKEGQAALMSGDVTLPIIQVMVYLAQMKEALKRVT